MLTQRQKQVIAGAFLLALGISTGVVVSPDDGPSRDDQLAEIAARGPDTIASGHLDAEQYHRAVRAIRKQRADITDLLTSEVAPGAVVTTIVKVELGARPGAIELTGLTTAFAVAPDFSCPKCGVEFKDDAREGLTTFTITARNTTSVPTRLTAFIHCAPRCVAE